MSEPDDWMHLSIEMPAEDGAALLNLLRDKLGFTDVDWCELQRADRARVGWGPSEPRTDSGFTVDPFAASSPGFADD